MLGLINFNAPPDMLTFLGDYFNMGVWKSAEAHPTTYRKSAQYTKMHGSL
jgi:hypothetical protein